MHKCAYVGLQTGDEGKGVSVFREIWRRGKEAMSKKGSILNIRFQGGSNAGHTIHYRGEKYVCHQVPSGLTLVKQGLPVKGLMGSGVFVNPKDLAKEIGDLRREGININRDNFFVSSNAHVTLDFHVAQSLDNYGDGIGQWSCTGSGIKQTAERKSGRKGVRFQEFLNPDSFRRILEEENYLDEIRELRAPDGSRKYEGYGDFVESYMGTIEKLRDFSVLETDLFDDSSILFGVLEGAQGADLCVEDGLYPGTTSTTPTKPSHRPEMIYGVFKAYESSVGYKKRVFISKMEKELEDTVREEWGEYGSTTNRPRGVGWFDAVKGKQRIAESGVDRIILTCLDKLEFLGRIGEKIRVVTSYELDGKKYDSWRKELSDRETIKRVVPVMTEFEPWTRTVESDGRTLTPNARNYVEGLENLLGMKFSRLGIGPGLSDYLEITA